MAKALNYIKWTILYDRDTKNRILFFFFVFMIAEILHENTKANDINSGFALLVIIPSWLCHKTIMSWKKHAQRYYYSFSSSCSIYFVYFLPCLLCMAEILWEIYFSSCSLQKNDAKNVVPFFQFHCERSKLFSFSFIRNNAVPFILMIRQIVFYYRSVSFVTIRLSPSSVWRVQISGVYKTASINQNFHSESTTFDWFDCINNSLFKPVKWIRSVFSSLLVHLSTAIKPSIENSIK